MPRRTEAQCMPTGDHCCEVAAILAQGILRWRERPRAAEIVPPPEPESPRKGLEFPRETRLSASRRTRGLRLRNVGDDV